MRLPLRRLPAARLRMRWTFTNRRILRAADDA
jgi:hypothetical protein